LETCQKAWLQAIEHMDEVEQQRGKVAHELSIVVKTPDGHRVRMDREEDENEKPSADTLHHVGLISLQQHSLLADYDKQQIEVAEGERKGWVVFVSLGTLRDLCREGYAITTAICGEIPQPGSYVQPGTKIKYSITELGSEKIKELDSALSVEEQQELRDFAQTTERKG
jgi:hypothetical protein